jgi:hypothetical protein
VIDPNLIYPQAAQPSALQIVMPQAEQWKLYALRLGSDEYKAGKLIFQGTFMECNAWLDWVENIPMNTPGMEAITQIQKPQPYKMRCVGPLVTVVLVNGKKCVGLSFNDGE